MGMFDTLYSISGHGHQTKAFDCNLNEYRIRDKMPDVIGSYYGPGTEAPADYQVEVFDDTYATIRDGRLSECPAALDPDLPLYNYSGYLVPPCRRPDTPPLRLKGVEVNQ